MRPDPVKASEIGDPDVRRASASGCISRRELLRATAVAGVGALAARTFGAPVASSASAPTQPASAPAARDLWWLGPEHPQSRVVSIRSSAVVAEQVVNEAELHDMLDLGLQVLTRQKSRRDAWQRILGSARTVTLKFNQVGAAEIGTNAAFARVLVRSLRLSGFEPSQVVLIEAGADLDLGTRTAVSGWGAPLVLGEQKQPLANWLYETDALVSIGLLKTHQAAGMSGVMKNISHAVVRHPARLHANGCSPYVRQLLCSHEVSSRLRLCILSALRSVVRNGPDARREDIVDSRRVLLGFDPVAVDVTGRDLLAALRHDAGISERLEVPYLTDAIAGGAGRHAKQDIDLVEMTTGSA